MKNILAFGFLSIILSGCMGINETVPADYRAVTSIKGSGDVHVGRFIYSPADGILRPNQYQTADDVTGWRYLSENVDQFMQNALKQELETAGFNVTNSANLEITGDVKKLLFDWIGFSSASIYLNVEYVVKNGNKIVYQDIIRTEQSMPKSKMNVWAADVTNKVFAENIDILLNDLQRKKILFK